MIEATTRRVLDNGLTVLLRPARHAPVATFWLWYRVGSRNEHLGITGASHWVEHMLFKGSTRFPKGEVDRLVSREGGLFNGMTWLDWTTYFVTLPADSVDLALDVEADRMQGALFEPDETESERSVIIAEREGHENSPMFQLMEEVQSIAIKVHPYRHEVIGWKSDLVAMTRDDLYQHYTRHYHPANAVAVAVGAFDVDATLEHIAARFGDMPRGAAPRVTPVPEPEQRGERRVTVVGEDPTAYVVVSYPAPAAKDPDYFAFQVLATVLGGAQSMNLFGGPPPNRSSRLYRALVVPGLAAAVSCDLVATIDPFLYTVSAVVRDGADAAAVEAGIVAEVGRLLVEPLTEADLARARKQARAQFAYSFERVTDQGFWLGLAEIVADQGWLDGYLERLDGVTAADVQQAARAYLDPRRRTVGHYVPQQPSGEGDVGDDGDDGDDGDHGDHGDHGDPGDYDDAGDEGDEGNDASAVAE